MKLRSACLLGCLLYCCTAVAATTGTQIQPVEVPRSQQLTLHSKATGRDYLIQVAVPKQPPPESGYAVLYVLDGNAYWPLLRTAHRMFSRHGPHARPQPLLIIGVGYPGEQMYDYTARAEDYTPFVPDYEPRRSDREVGGATQFLTFIREQLQPAINSRFNVDEREQAVIGHSFGGLFVLYMLLAAPDTFDHYLAISPSLWWGQGNMQYYLRQAQQHPVAPDSLAASCLFVGLGSEERRSARRSHVEDRKSRRGAGMPQQARRLMQDLRVLYPGLDSQLVIFPGEHHGTVMWPAARRALAYLHRCGLADG